MSKKVSSAIAVLVVLAGLLLWQSSAEDAGDHQAPGLTVELPKFERDKVDALEITSPENGVVKLEKGSDGWRVTAPLAAPAAQATVDTALDKLAALTVVGVAATKADNHARLEVDDEKALKISVGQGGGEAATLKIGVYRSGNTMLRVADAALVASVEGSIRFAFDKALKEWRNREITKLEVASVQRVQFESDKGTVVLEKDGETFKQAEGQTPIEKFDPVKAKSVVGSVCSLRAVDFQAAPDLEALGLGAAPKGRVTVTVGGDKPETLVVLVGEKKDNYYYAKRADSPVVYTVSAFMGERLGAGPEDFVKEEPKPIDPKQLEAAGAQMPPGGGNALPPEIMEQVQRQLRAQGIKPQ